MPGMSFTDTPVMSRRSAIGPHAAPNALVESEPVSEPVRLAVEHWHAMRGAAPIPLRRALDPLDIPSLLPNAELIEVLRQPLDFRYRLIGDAIDRISRDYYVGRRISEIPGQRPPSQLFALYAETVKRGAPVCVTLDYVGDDRFIDHVEAVTMPLSDDGTRVETLWGIVVPVETERRAR